MGSATCSIEGCAKKAKALGMCVMHYKRVRKHGDPHHITEKRPPSQRRHGASSVNGKAAPEYNAWSSMKGRCTNPNLSNYADYGGRGISVCERWTKSFDAFLADMGPRPTPRHSLDRIDNDGPYSPENCRWADRLEQARNRRNNRLVLINDRLVTVTEAAAISGVNLYAFRNRIRRGWPIERAIK